MNRETGYFISDEKVHIQQSIKDIITTPLGSRLQRRDFGSNLYIMLDKPLSPSLTMQLANASIIAIKNWEPRITILTYKVSMKSDHSTKLVAEMSYKINDTGQVSQQSIVLTGGVN